MDPIASCRLRKRGFAFPFNLVVWSSPIFQQFRMYLSFRPCYQARLSFWEETYRHRQFQLLNVKCQWLRFCIFLFTKYITSRFFLRVDASSTNQSEFIYLTSIRPATPQECPSLSPKGLSFCSHSDAEKLFQVDRSLPLFSQKLLVHFESICQFWFFFLVCIGQFSSSISLHWFLLLWLTLHILLTQHHFSFVILSVSSVCGSRSNLLRAKK